MRLPQPKTIRGVIDQGDLEHVRRLGLNPVLAEPAPYKGNKINPHVTRFHNKDGSVTDVFHIKPVYYEAKDHLWRPMSEVASHHGNRKLVLKPSWASYMSLRYFQWLTKRQRLFPGKQLSIDTSLGFILQPEQYEYATDSTFYPDPNAETTTVDGAVVYDDATYSTARNAVTGESAFDSPASETGAQHSLFGGIYYIRRAFFLFDTSSIPDTDTITEATFSYKLADNNGNNADATHTAAVVSSSPASNTAISTADYDQVGSTSFGSSAYTGTQNSYKDFSLNASGIANISKTGVSKFATRGTEDIANSAPTGLNQHNIFYADSAGTTSDPKLVVTHSAASSTFIPRVSFIM